MRSPIRVFPDADRVEEALVDAAVEGGGFADGSAFLTFGELVDALGGPRALGRRPCSPLTARVVLWAAAQRLGPGPFGASVHEPGFARAALDLVFELKAGGLGAEDFARAVEELPPSRAERARYLARLYAAYEARMAELKLADREDEVRGALLRVQQGELPEPILRAGRLELRGVYDFPPLRLELLLALARACESKRVNLLLELPGAGSAAVDLAVDPVLGAIERAGAELTYLDAHKTDLVGEGRPLAALGAHLFRLEVNKGAAAELGEKLELFSVASQTEECRQIARRAAALVGEGVPPEQIAIAYRDLGEEAERMVEALEELGIPARLRRGAPLASTAAGRVALSLPLLVDDAFPAAEVARAVSSRYLPEVSRPEVDAPARWLQLASVRDDQVGARGEKGAYEVRLTALADRMDRARAGSGWGARQLLERCQKLFAIGRQLPAEATALQHLTRWWRALGDLGLAKALERPEPRGSEGTSLGRAVLRALARDQAASEALRAMYRELHLAFDQSGAGQARLSRRVFHRWLQDAAVDFNLAPRGPRAGAVRVLDLRQVVGRQFAHVCVGGVADGRLPGREAPSALFPDEDRRRVNRFFKRDAFRLSTGEADGRAPWRAAEDRLLFALALSASRDKATLSFARLTAAGQEQIGSPFLTELERLTGARLEQRELRPVPLLDDAYSQAQLRQRVAMEVYGRPDLRVSRPDPAASAMGRHFARQGWLRAAGELVAIEVERLHFFSDLAEEAGAHSGLVGTGGLEAELAERFRLGPDRPLSASALARYANCAFQGFAASVLGLEEPEAPGEELAPRDKGSFWHRVLEELFPRLREAGLLRRPAEEIPDAVLDEAVEVARARAEARTHVGHPSLWEIDRERARSMVRRVLAAEGNGLPFPQHQPEHVELTFGRRDSPEGWREVVIPGVAGEQDVFVEGKIDRLDRGPSGWAVIDYKSGAVRKSELKADLLETEFQLPLYLLAARSAGARHAVHAAWVGLKTGEPLALAEVVEAAKAGTLEEMLATDAVTRKRAEAEGKRNLANAVHSVVGELRRGRFAARPKDCEWCSYRAVCRITDRRLEEEVVGS
ncbi:MAG TPA: PD-(D/E)XK nuclease family protein [Myxococcales bacterium]|nr:PD-(D/E)XK nuclease family protein [Myxococcales bacterium]